jgi:hypothetical protein
MLDVGNGLPCILSHEQIPFELITECQASARLASRVCIKTPGQTFHVELTGNEDAWAFHKLIWAIKRYTESDDCAKLLPTATLMT